MTERFEPSLSGPPTVFFGQTALHSHYNPEKEAVRYSGSLAVKHGAGIFLFIEPALGYTVKALRERFPLGRMIALHCSPAFAGAGEPDAEWHPECGISLDAFLSDRIADEEVPAVQLVEWKPSMNAYGSRYAELVSRCAVFLRRGMANAATTRHFGKRWDRNARKNRLYRKKVLGFTPGDCPVLITGSGPELESVLPALKDAVETRRAFLLASSSSVPALRSAGIAPSLTITSDGGNWARCHILDGLRLVPGRAEGAESAKGITNNAEGAGVPGGPLFAAAFNAALPSQCSGYPVLFIGDGSRAAGELLSGLPHLTLPQRGTVTACALDLALLLSSGPLYFAGMDLKPKDIQSHARPYALDAYVAAGTKRLDPYYSRSWERVEKSKSLNPLGIYASWFREQFPRVTRPCYVLGPLSPLLDGLLSPAEKVKEEGKTFPSFTVYSSGNGTGDEGR
ncbi:MAG: hypothetical protein LBK64_01715 [Spirochaetaceae bacterium]|jgi:hypothetical protein|nr:hypothetical protein [Spirochaetaceae bacterium]